MYDTTTRWRGEGGSVGGCLKRDCTIQVIVTGRSAKTLADSKIIRKLRKKNKMIIRYSHGFKPVSNHNLKKVQDYNLFSRLTIKE